MKNLLAIGTTITVAALILLSELPSIAAEIKVQFDDNKMGQHNNATGQGAIGNANFGALAPFSSRGFMNGSLIKNASTITLEDIHLKLISAGDTFDPASTGGGAFPNVMLSKDKKEITLSGGNIKPNDSFWSMIPLSEPFTGGVGKYEGRATPTTCPAPNPAPKQSGAGSDFMLSPSTSCGVPEPSSISGLFLFLSALGASSTLTQLQKKS